MVDEPQLEYRSVLPIPQAKRVWSPYALWLFAISFLAIVLPSMLVVPDRSGLQPDLIASAVLLLGLSLATGIDIRRTRRRGLAAILVGGTVGLLMAFATYETATQPSRGEKHSRIRCLSNLRQIGQAAYLYRHDYGVWPGDLRDLLVESLDVKTLSCPGDTSGDGYFYLRPSSTDPQNIVVIAFERPNHFDGTTLNYLTSEGRADTIQGESAIRALAELAAGQNPPPSLGLGPTTQAAGNTR